MLDAAMRLFWLQGYDGVTAQSLISGMGINPKSIYAEFGNKQKLYHAALERYLTVEVPTRFTELNADNTGLQAVLDTLERFAQAPDRKGTERGCMLCNAASEVAYQDDTVRGLADDYFKVSKTSFAQALDGAVFKGELQGGFDSDAWSSSLATTLVGMFVMIRSRVDGSMVRAAADLAYRQLVTYAEPSN